MVESKTAETALGLRVRRMNTPLGEIIALAEDDAYRGLWFRGQKYEGMGGGDPALWQRGEAEDPVFRSLERWLDEYFAGRQPQEPLILRPAGSPFRQQVWQLLCRIPWGSTVTYGQLAKEMAAQLGRQTMSAQAVGGAVGHNPISILIPCHRVVGTDGSLTGYAGGLERKQALLALERGEVPAYR